MSGDQGARQSRMTLRVSRVSPEGEVLERGSEQHVVARPAAGSSVCFPPCSCPRHRDQRAQDQPDTTIIRSANLTLRTEMVDGAPRSPLYEAVCCTCQDTSEEHEGDRLTPEVWAIKHAALHPGHNTFRGLITSFWRVFPTTSHDHLHS